MTLSLLWQEYKALHPEGLQYSWFCIGPQSLNSSKRSTPVSVSAPCGVAAIAISTSSPSRAARMRAYGAPGFLGHGLRENPMSKEVGGMVGSRRVQGAGSARTEGARRASGVGADGAAVGAGALAPGQRWSASRKRDVVLRLLRGESLDTVSREVGVELYRLEAWKARALAGIELGLKALAGEPLAAELDAATRHIGELSMEIELLRERARAAERRLPLATRRSRR